LVKERASMVVRGERGSGERRMSFVCLHRFNHIPVRERTLVLVLVHTIEEA
jgi:hypothetical protein